MTRLLHLTDLHFGHERAELVTPLAAAIRAADPGLIVVTGDLAHRARRGQFRRAMGFLNGLGLPFVTLPGNHDVPLINLALRFLCPFRGWRRAVSPLLTPQAQLGPVRIHSANTANPHSWRRGIFRMDDLYRILGGLTGDAVHVLACHHPLIEPPGFERGETRGAPAALPVLARNGVRIVLSGHLHHWSIGLGITATQPQPLLMVQTGTALCGREGEKDHGFSTLDIAGDRVAVTPWIIDEGSLTFVPRPALRFTHGRAGWLSDPG